MITELSPFVLFSRSKKDKAKGVVKPDSSDPEPEGLTLLVPDIQRTAEIVYAATTSLRQANQGKPHTHLTHCLSGQGPNLQSRGDISLDTPWIFTHIYCNT